MNRPAFDLVAVDLDGTLLDSRWRLTPAGRQAVADLTAAGIRVVPATGRRFAMGAPYAEAAGLRGPIICQNGAVIRNLACRSVIAWHAVNPGLARAVIRCGRTAGFAPIVFHDPTGPGQVRLDARIRLYHRLERYLAQSWNDITLSSRLDLPDSPITQVTFCGGVTETRRLADRCRERVGTDANLLATEYPARDLALLDVMSPLASKGRALDTLARHFGVDPARTAALGDNLNDTDMLERAGLALVMGNAPDSLRWRGPRRRVLPGCDQDGAAWGIWRHILPRLDRLRAWFPRLEALTPAGRPT